MVLDEYGRFFRKNPCGFPYSGFFSSILEPFLRRPLLPQGSGAKCLPFLCTLCAPSRLAGPSAGALGLAPWASPRGQPKGPRVRKTAAAWQRAKGRGNFSGNSKRPVSLFTPLFISLLHKTATVPRRGPSSLVWWGPGAVYSTVQPGRRPCAWDRRNAPRTRRKHEYLHFRTHTKPLIFQQFRTFPAILLSVCFISPPARPAFSTHPLRVRVRFRYVSRSPSSLRALVSEYRKMLQKGKKPHQDAAKVAKSPSPIGALTQLTQRRLPPLHNARIWTKI